MIDGPESADAVSRRDHENAGSPSSSTSISGAINFAVQLFEQNPYRGLRRVIDISGDGPNNDGAPVTGARDAAGEGHRHQRPAHHGEEAVLFDDRHRNLDLYYEDCVIGGPGAFIMTIRIAKNSGSNPDQACSRSCRPHAGQIVPAADKEPRVPCLIGERKWQERRGQ